MKNYMVIILSIILPVLLSVTGCGGGAIAKAGDTVRVHYTGTLADGTQFDSSAGKDPLEFTLGAGQVIPGFNEAITGMRAGEKKTITIPAEQAYGGYHPELVFEVSKDRLPSGKTPEIGMQLQMRQEDGTIIPMIIIEVNDSTVKLDANHPLAGMDLTFEIELVKIVKQGRGN